MTIFGELYKTHKFLIKINGQVAQLVEQRTENPRVGSSILPLATISISMTMDIINDGKCDEA